MVHDTGPLYETEGLKEKPTGGIRLNKGKIDVSLVPPEVILGIAEVLTKGLEKYPARNWELGYPRSYAYASLLRHLLKWFSGEDNDQETGLSHIKHVAANAAILTTLIERDIGDDDRPCKTHPYPAKASPRRER